MKAITQDAPQYLEADDRDPSFCIASARRLKQLGRLEETLDTLRRGISRYAPSAPLYEYYIERLEKCNQTEEAISAAGKASALFPSDLIFQFWERLLLPVVYRNSEEVQHYRRRYSQGLCELSEQLSLETQDDRRRALDAIGKHVNYYLGYQGENVLEDQKRYGALISRVMEANYPQWANTLRMPSLGENGKLRIGYVSSVFFESTSAAKNSLGWLREHSRQELSLYTYYTGKTTDYVTEEVKRISYGFRHLPNSLEDMCRAIRNDALHVLIYLDIGLRPVTAQLASLRLAPIQCATLEAPLTTGLPTVDYYLSSDLMEPDDGQGHYSEELVRLPGVGISFRKPVIPTSILNKTRVDFGLRDDAIVYLCCQTISKYLPDSDDVFWKIAQRIPNAQFVFLAPNGLLGRDFANRLEREFASVGLKASDYCKSLPTCNLLNYWNLHLVSDVYLDTMGWSGGISTFEAIACRLPVVTMPGRFMRGRHSYAILQQLGVTETIAADKDQYVEIATKLGSDRGWRQSVVGRIVGGYSRLYSDTSSVRALEQIFRANVTGKISHQKQR